MEMIQRRDSRRIPHLNIRRWRGISRSTRLPRGVLLVLERSITLLPVINVGL